MASLLVWLPSMTIRSGRPWRLNACRTHHGVLGREPQGDADRLKPNWTKHAKAAPFRRNDDLLSTMPAGVIVFPGSGITGNLPDEARSFAISVWRFGGDGA
jgi:hypothetical protein